MRVLVVYAHPLETSFNASLHRQILVALHKRGHYVDDCDLYSEHFDPVLTAESLSVYRDIKANRNRVASYVERLQAAEALLLIFPVWNEGFPAILKGFLDRVFLPGVSFTKDSRGRLEPGLRHIDKLGAVCTYGASRFATMFLGDPTRRVVKRLLRAMTGGQTRCDYLALYDMDRAKPDKCASFQRKVIRTFESW